MLFERQVVENEGIRNRGQKQGKGMSAPSFGGEELLERRMGAHEYPRGIEFVDEPPMTPTGEVRRGVPRRRGEVGT